MFQINKFNALFNCQLCQKGLKDPISLPCGETVCTEELSQANCMFCSDNHKTPKNGFPANKIVQNQLELNFNKINQNFSQFNDYKKIIEDLNKKLKETESIRQDPEYYIDEYFGELTRQVDLRRETQIEDIHQYSDGSNPQKKHSKEVGELLEPVLEQFKLELQGKTFFGVFLRHDLFILDVVHFQAIEHEVELV